jgi:hypothetical protein
MQNVPNNQIKYRKRIGFSGKKPVFEIGTIGGLVLVAEQNVDNKLKVLGSGSHKTLARFLAKKYEPALNIDLIEKSEDGEIEDFREFLPFWEQVTLTLRNG